MSNNKDTHLLNSAGICGRNGGVGRVKGVRLNRGPLALPNEGGEPGAVTRGRIIGVALLGNGLKLNRVTFAEQN